MDCAMCMWTLWYMYVLYKALVWKATLSCIKKHASYT